MHLLTYSIAEAPIVARSIVDQIYIYDFHTHSDNHKTSWKIPYLFKITKRHTYQRMPFHMYLCLIGISVIIPQTGLRSKIT